MRSSPSDGEEIWCRCDAGPHGFLSIAAHAHADALAVEVRYDGVDVLADPGTYCYHGEPLWRSYFRSTLAHNTIEVGGQDQSTSGGPFLWTRHAHSQLVELETDARRAGHDVVRRARRLSLPRPLRSATAGRCDSRADVVASRSSTASRRRDATASAWRSTWAPRYRPRMVGRTIELRWSQGTSDENRHLSLPEGLSWSLSRGATDPILGWYSPRFGENQPAWAVMGEGPLQRDRHRHL